MPNPEKNIKIVKGFFNRVSLLEEDKEPISIVIPQKVKTGLIRTSEEILGKVLEKNNDGILFKKTTSPDIFVLVGDEADLGFAAVEGAFEKYGFKLPSVVLKNSGLVLWQYDPDGKSEEFGKEYERWLEDNNNETVRNLVKNFKDELSDYRDRITNYNHMIIGVVTDWPSVDQEFYKTASFLTRKTLKEIREKEFLNKRIWSMENNLIKMDFSSRHTMEVDDQILNIPLIKDYNWINNISLSITRNLKFDRNISLSHMSGFIEGLLVGIKDPEYLGEEITNQAKLKRGRKNIIDPYIALRKNYNHDSLEGLRASVRREIKKIGESAVLK